MKKTCIICDEYQPLSEYYKHARMGDGHLNKCKTCCKKQAKEREEKLRADPEWVEAERKRGREKYHRLEYKNNKPDPDVVRRRMATERKKYPEKYRARIASQYIKCEEGIQRHHWSYQDKHHKDVILLDTPTHAALHRYLVYDNIELMYRDREGNLLDSREKHEEYLNTLLPF